jgi:hypothetical protein
MLFDLRSPRRRFAIRIVYGFLAVLIGGGLVLFGVGGGAGSTGLLSQLAQQGNGSSSAVKYDESAMLRTQKAARRAPSDVAAWDRYAAAAYALAATNESSSGWTHAGAQELNVAWKAWQHYISLSPPKPDGSLAEDLATAFGAPTSGIGLYKRAEQAQEIVAQDQSTNADEYAALAIYAYMAKDYDSASLAQSKAASLASKSQRKTILSEISQEVGELGGSTGATGATG